MKLLNYIEYKKTFKNITKSRQLLSNLARLESGLSGQIIIVNRVFIPEVSEFLVVAADVLGYRLEELTSCEQLDMEMEDTLQNGNVAVLYYVPAWVVREDQEGFGRLVEKVLEQSGRKTENRRRKAFVFNELSLHRPRRRRCFAFCYDS